MNEDLIQAIKVSQAFSSQTMRAIYAILSVPRDVELMANIAAQVEDLVQYEIEIHRIRHNI